MFILANPSSGKKQAEEYAKNTKELYEKKGWQATIKITQEKADISRFTKEACENEFDILIVLGGDGTVSELVNALKKVKQKPTIGIVPTGTVNNIAQGLGMNTDPEKAVNELIEGSQKTIDVGEINDQLFVSSISAGSIPATVWKVSKEQKEKLGPLAYFIEGLKSLNDNEPYSVEIRLDNQEPIEIDLSLLVVGVSNSIFGIDYFFDNAHYDDKKLHLFCVKQTNLGKQFVTFSRVLTNNEVTSEDNIAFSTTFEQASFQLKQGKTNVALDGEKGPTFPLTVKIHPHFVNFLVPA